MAVNFSTVPWNTAQNIYYNFNYSVFCTSCRNEVFLPATGLSDLPSPIAVYPVLSSASNQSGIQLAYTTDTLLLLFTLTRVLTLGTCRSYAAAGDTHVQQWTLTHQNDIYFMGCASPNASHNYIAPLVYLGYCHKYIGYIYNQQDDDYASDTNYNDCWPCYGQHKCYGAMPYTTFNATFTASTIQATWSVAWNDTVYAKTFWNTTLHLSRGNSAARHPSTMLLLILLVGVHMMTCK